MDGNRQIVVATLPTGRLREEDFELRRAAIPEPGDGEVLCRTLAITVRAGQRAQLQGSAHYAGAPSAEVVMSGTGVARVERSNDPAVPAGALVAAATRWQDWSVHRAADVEVLDDEGDATLHLGVLGSSGLTAYVGLIDVGRPREGETVLVSAAAGSVGHIVGQIARIAGCRVVGTTGSDDKAAVLTGELGFDAAVNHHDPDLDGALRAACPGGVDVYFDGTGGDVLAAALRRMNVHGRIVCCGVVSQYDTTNPAPGPRGVPGLLVTKRLRMEGFLVADFADRFADARRDLRTWIADGRLSPRQDTFEGLESAPRAFVDLLAGGNVGTRVVRVAD